MPTYKNTSNTPISINSVTFKFLEDAKVPFYIDLKKYPNLKKISDEPIFDPVDFSQSCSGGSSFDILNNKTKDTNLIRIVSKDEISEISFNSKNSNIVAVTRNVPLEIRNIDNYEKIFIKTGTVSIELWKSFYWRY